MEKRISDAINADLKGFLGVLRDDAEALWKTHSFLAQANGSGQPPKTRGSKAFLPGGPEPHTA